MHKTWLDLVRSPAAPINSRHHAEAAKCLCFATMAACSIRQQHAIHHWVVGPHMNYLDDRGDEAAIWHGYCQRNVDVLVICDALAIRGAGCKAQQDMSCV